MKYKAIVHTPFHNIGDIFDSNDYDWNLRKFPELYEELVIELKSVTEDGISIQQYDTCYYITDNFDIKPFNYQEHNLGKIFHQYSNAVDYLRSLINIKLDDGAIVTEFVEKLYSVCATSNWQLGTVDSFTLYKRKNRTSGISSHWKFFKTKESRDEYIKWNRPLYSLNDIVQGEYKIY